MKLRRWQLPLVSLLGAGFLRLLGATWRYRVAGSPLPPMPDAIGAFLHGDMLMPAIQFRRLRVVVMISQHGDGEVIARVVQRLGFGAVRGSSTRGGARASLELLRKHHDRPWAITPDGPRGPRGTVHEGVIQIAAESGRPIVPLGYAASSGKQLSSWDRFMIPAPFARIACWQGEPMAVAAGLDREARARLALDLQRRLTEAHEQAVRTLQPAR